MAIVTQTTQGIQVSVLTEYQPEHSHPGHFVFTYKIAIENNSEQTVQLLRRRWHIFDSNGTTREVEGEGVVGQQPVLEPGERYEYVSGCNLRTSIGRMKGTYQMERVVDGKMLTVSIPEFVMIVPYRLN
jgi:ApaG protein